MKKVLVGIVPNSTYLISDDPYQDKYSFVNGYSKKIIEAGAVPIGLLLSDDNLCKETLDLCDAFLIQGGNKVSKYMYEIIYYALMNNKPLLGICLGAQAIDIFSVILDRIDLKKPIEITNIIEVYQQLKEENEGSLLRKIASPNIHGDVVINRSNIDSARHDIEIVESSILYSVYKTSRLSVVSLHGFDFKHVGKNFIVSARTDDGVCEAIEYKDHNYFILGVHFHPELEENNLIFERLVLESEKRKTQEKVLKM